MDLLEGLLVKKAGMQDAVGLVEGLYPGAVAAGFRNFPDSATTKAPRISEVYTRGKDRRRAGAGSPSPPPILFSTIGGDWKAAAPAVIKRRELRWVQR